MNNIPHTLFFSVITFFCYGFNLNATDITFEDRQQISNVLGYFEHAVNTSNYQDVAHVIEPNNQKLLSLIREKMEGIKKYKLSGNVFDENIEVNNNSKRVKISCNTFASGVNWKHRGFSTYFVLNKNENQWLITAYQLS